MEILLVDDEASFLEQASLFLSKAEGFAEALLESEESLNIDTTNSIKGAMEKLDKNSYEAVISDYKMPDKNGLEFLKIVREDRNSDIPFILFTGKGNEEIALKALSKGANRYFEKGGDPDSQYRSLIQATVQEAQHRRKVNELKKEIKKYKSKLENHQKSD